MGSAPNSLNKARCTTVTLTSKHPLIGQRFPIGSHGFVELLDFMGSDQDIAEAAWVSTEFGTLKKSPLPQFLDYLMRHGHWSPFEMCEVKFRISLPLAIQAQLATHRTASRNQASARYVELPDLNQKTASGSISGTRNDKSCWLIRPA